MKLNKMGAIRIAGWSLAAVAVVALFLVVNSLGVHALKVRTEIKSMPAGIAKIIDIGGKPPKGLLNPKGSRLTALTINTDIEFGNVFPGETQQGEFIVYLNTAEKPEHPGPYTRVEYHLILGTQPGNLDLSPYLTIVRTDAVEDVDPDYPYPLPPPPYPPYTPPDTNLARASLDSNLGDTEDRWLVTLTLPDDPPSGDYWMTITVWVDSTVPP